MTFSAGEAYARGVTESESAQVQALEAHYDKMAETAGLTKEQTATLTGQAKVGGGWDFIVKLGADGSAIWRGQTIERDAWNAVKDYAESHQVTDLWSRVSEASRRYSTATGTSDAASLDESLSANLSRMRTFQERASLARSESESWSEQAAQVRSDAQATERELGRQKRIRGAEMVTAGELRRRVQAPHLRVLSRLPGAARFRPYSIAGIPYPERTETRHTIVSGTTGSGKTVLISDLVAQISGNWRAVFRFEDGEAVDGDLTDRHGPRWSAGHERRCKRSRRPDAEPDALGRTHPREHGRCRLELTETAARLGCERGTLSRLLNGKRACRRTWRWRWRTSAGKPPNTGCGCRRATSLHGRGGTGPLQNGAPAHCTYELVRFSRWLASGRPPCS